MTSLTEREVFALADRALDAVVAQITDEQWVTPMPESFRTRMIDHTPTLREVINYHAYDDAWIPDVLGGRTMAEVGLDAHKGDLLGDTPKAAFRVIVDLAVAAAAALDDLGRTVHLSYGDYTAQQYLWQANYFRGTRAYDLARIIGVDPALPDDLVQGLWDEVRPVAEEWRGIGVMGSQVPVADGAPLLDRLLGLIGRAPDVG